MAAVYDLWAWLTERKARARILALADIRGGCPGISMAGPIAAAGFKVISRDYVQQMLFPSEVILARKI